MESRDHAQGRAEQAEHVVGERDHREDVPGDGHLVGNREAEQHQDGGRQGPEPPRQGNRPAHQADDAGNHQQHAAQAEIAAATFPMTGARQVRQEARPLAAVQEAQQVQPPGAIGAEFAAGA